MLNLIWTLDFVSLPEWKFPSGWAKSVSPCQCYFSVLFPSVLSLHYLVCSLWFSDMRLILLFFRHYSATQMYFFLVVVGFFFYTQLREATKWALGAFFEPMNLLTSILTDLWLLVAIHNYTMSLQAICDLCPGWAHSQGGSWLSIIYLFCGMRTRLRTTKSIPYSCLLASAQTHHLL